MTRHFMHADIVDLPGLGLVEVAGHEAYCLSAFRMDSAKKDILHIIDLIGDSLASTTESIPARRQLLRAAIAGMMPQSDVGRAIQHLCLFVLRPLPCFRAKSNDNFDAGIIQNAYKGLSTSAGGSAGRLATETFILRDRLASGSPLDVLEFIEMPCLIRCIILGQRQGLMN